MVVQKECCQFLQTDNLNGLLLWLQAFRQRLDARDIFSFLNTVHMMFTVFICLTRSHHLVILPHRTNTFNFSIIAPEWNLCNVTKNCLRNILLHPKIISVASADTQVFFSSVRIYWPSFTVEKQISFILLT